MPQQTSPDVQSPSTWQNLRPFSEGWQDFRAPEAKLVDTHACPTSEAQVMSFVQNWGQLMEGWQVPPDGPGQQSSPAFV
jgi:hypothetical protein